VSLVARPEGTEGMTADLDALAELLDGAAGLEVAFPDGISEHGRRLVESFGVEVVE